MNSELNTNSISEQPGSCQGGLKQHLCRLISIQIDNLLANSYSNQSSVYQIDEAFEAADDRDNHFIGHLSHPLV